MSTENLPDVYSGNDVAISGLDLGFEFSDSSGQAAIPTIYIDQGRGPNAVQAGTFNFGGEALESMVWVPITMREVRRLMLRSFEQRQGEEDNEISCLSWDGQNAIGRGGRDITQSRSPRKCNGCPSGVWEDDKPALCRPSLELLVMVQIASEDGGHHWTPAFFVVRGQNVKHARNAFRLANSAAFRHKIPLCYFGFQSSMDSSGKNGTWVLKNQGPKKVEEDDVMEIREFVAKNDAISKPSPALAVWEARIKSDHNLAKTIGDLDGIVTDSPIESDGEVPF